VAASTAAEAIPKNADILNLLGHAGVAM
jgi:hypothetical protein